MSFHGMIERRPPRRGLRTLPCGVKDSSKLSKQSQSRVKQKEQDAHGGFAKESNPAVLFSIRDAERPARRYKAEPCNEMNIQYSGDSVFEN